MYNPTPETGCDTITERVEAMAKLTAELRGTVSRMVALYYEDDALNSIQPPSFERVIPMSLDEWACTLGETVEQWEALAADHRAKDQAAEFARTEPFRAAGFSYEFPGYWSKELPNGATVNLSGSDGSDSPTASDYCVTCYAPGAMEAGLPAALDLRSSDEGQTLTYDQALAAALAAAQAFPAPSSPAQA